MRRGQRDRIRLAFVNTKCRIGEERAPFVLEIDFRAQPWTVRDVTEDMLAAGKEAAAQAVRAGEDLRTEVTATLVAEVGRLAEQATQAGDHEALLRHTTAVQWVVDESAKMATKLHAFGLKPLSRKQSRALVTEGTGTHLQIVPIPGARGNAEVLVPLQWDAAQIIAVSANPRQSWTSQPRVSAARASRD